VEALQIAIAIGCLIFLSSLLVLHGFFKRPLNLRERLNSSAVMDSEETVGLLKRLEKVLIPIGEMLPRSPKEMSRQERRLVQAGIRRKDAVILLNASHLLIAGLLLLAFASKGYLYRQPMLFVVLSLLLGAAIPDIWLKTRTEKRKLNIQHGLPDAMDLAVIAIEAGLGLDQALAAEYGPGPVPADGIRDARSRG